MTRLELATFGLEVQRAIQLRHTGVHEVGFEPTKQLHQILSLTPLTRLGNPCLISGLLVSRRSDTFPLELLETNYALPRPSTRSRSSVVHRGIRTHGHMVKSHTLYQTELDGPEFTTLLFQLDK
jgi:hypothetical protein